MRVAAVLVRGAGSSRASARYEVTGNISLMDRLETLAFNSLPAALWPDVTTNVYFHASNRARITAQPL